MKQLFQLEGFLPYRFDRLAKHISVSLASVYRDRFGVSVPQWRILALLHETPHMSARDIARQGNLDKVKVSRAVAGLEARSLLERQVNLADARVSELCLTVAGTRLFEAIAPLALAWETNLLEVLSNEERRDLTHLLSKLERHTQASDQVATAIESLRA